MFRTWIVMIALLSLAPPGSAGERFSGSGKLAEAATASVARFSLQAELIEHASSQKTGSHPANYPNAPQPLEMTNARFGLTARFTDALAGSLCGPTPLETIFANGFEN